MACSSSCPNPGTHQTFGECLRAKRIQIEGVDAHKYNAGIRRQLDEYARARYAGLQPKTVFKKDVEAAWKATEATGVPYRADQ